jgi:hypothetical protein
VSWISPGPNPDGTQGQAVAALLGQPGGGGGSTNPFAVPAGTNVTSSLSIRTSSRRVGKSHNRRETVRVTNPTSFSTGTVTVRLLLLQRKGKKTAQVFKNATTQVAPGSSAVLTFTVNQNKQRVRGVQVLEGVA